MSDLKFGTSGLRGLVAELTDEVCAAYAAAFLAHLDARGLLNGPPRLLIGQDLRGSSPRIAAACAAAARGYGAEVESCGALPTPALALRALETRCPAIMVTGSHIPDDRNGLKFYRADGEIDKADEAGILAALAGAPTVERIGPAGNVSHAALAAYRDRAFALAGPGSLASLRVGVYQHSSVARDLLVEVLRQAGAETIALGRSDVFVPVDTEALRPEDVAFARQAAEEHRFDALVSTDGDADRPLIVDETGSFLRGDTIGLLTARFLGADAVVTPVTSNSAVERSGLFARVTRTRVGSPFVIAGMEEARSAGARTVVGFEANGGVLLGSDVTVEGRRIAALPTRDAMLPILGLLLMAAREGKTLSALQSDLPARFTASGRIEDIASSLSKPFLDGLADDGVRRRHFAGFGPLEGCDAIDGVRAILAGGEILHYRASGNAPELRCYAEAGSQARAEDLLASGLAAARDALTQFEDRSAR